MKKKEEAVKIPIRTERLSGAPRPRAALAFTAVAFIAILLTIFHFSSPFMEPIFWAAVLAVAFHPFYRKLGSVLHEKSTAAGVLTLLVLLSIAPFFAYGIFEAAKQLMEFSDSMGQSIRDGTFQHQVDQMLTVPWLRQNESVLYAENVLRERLPEWGVAIAKTAGSFAALHAAAMAKSIFISSLKFLLMLFMLFFFLRDGDRLSYFLLDLLPLENHHKSRIFEESRDIIRAVVQGMFAMGIVKGVLSSILFFATGTSYALLLGIATFFSSLLPVVGSAVVWFPVSFSYLLDGDYTRAAIILTAGVIIVSSVDNVLQPLMVGRKTKMPYSVITLAMLGGMMTYGMAGLFIGPLALSLFLALVPVYREKIFRSPRERPAGPQEKMQSEEEIIVPERLAG